ncbi:tetratricopeptide repeat protein [Hyalangium sp.]|uniref:tetratricopeptide repeat protein n=1 Tax=Hyalangium sp. TaxID=2028555 RepID=UPI002D2897E3|nr:tetratricopeptide repeat protein [Hyalangium sp.]HYI02951.1 tetratricopeptide repeat protein [Hyalangium sp.]
MIRSPLLLLLALILVLPLAAWADPAGIQLYESGEYEAAAHAFEQTLADPQRASSERAKARLYLAASLHTLGKVEEARKHLELLAREHPEQSVDPDWFPPELVELAKVIREQIESESQFAARTAELERKAREEALRRPPPPLPLYVRPEAVSLFEAVDGRWTVGAGATLRSSSLEGSLRVLLGDPPAFHLQGGIQFGHAALRPFVGLRASLLPGLRSYGAGPAVGLRFALPAGMVGLAELGADYFFIGRDDRYRFALTAQAGLGFDLRLQ